MNLRFTDSGLLFEEIVPLKEETIRKCFPLPDNGLKVNHILWNCDGVFIYPISSEYNNHFSYNNGKVVFVHDDTTYVAKGYGIIKTLKAAGFEQASLWVPLSNGEYLLDPCLKEIWENLPEII